MWACLDLSVITKGTWCSVIHEDKRIIVEAYLDWLKTAVL